MESPAPQNPAGEFTAVSQYCIETRKRLTAEIGATPAWMRAAVKGLNDQQLDTKYRNWTIRQIVHHVADSHLNSMIRFKWTLTEDCPTIKAYEEADWVNLQDSLKGDVEPPLLLLGGLHKKWTQLLAFMTERQFEKRFIHPQSGDQPNLWESLNYYAWHGRHHSEQINWVRQQRGW